MKGVSFVQHTKLPDVAGRIRYISSEEEQEYLYAVYDTAPERFWQDLARENQRDYKRSGTSGNCIEARELIIALPKVYYEKGPPHDKLLKYFVDGFKDKYDVECTAALHHNHDRTNYHIHLIFSERRLLAEPEVKIAKRNMYYDPQGKHLRTAKEAKDDNGNLLPGYKMIPKGDPYETHIFEKKDPIFKGKAFTEEVKEFMTDLINTPLPEHLHMKTFPKNGPYMATRKVGKNNPMAAEIKEQNHLKDEWNRQMMTAEAMGIPEENMKMVKTELVTKPVSASIEQSKGAKDPQAFNEILLKAVKTLVVMVSKSNKMDPETRRRAWGEALKTFIEACAELAKQVVLPIRERGRER
jgi:MobA/MobL family.